MCVGSVPFGRFCRQVWARVGSCLRVGWPGAPHLHGGTPGGGVGGGRGVGVGGGRSCLPSSFRPLETEKGCFRFGLPCSFQLPCPVRQPGRACQTVSTVRCSEVLRCRPCICFSQCQCISFNVSFDARERQPSVTRSRCTVLPISERRTQRSNTPQIECECETQKHRETCQLGLFLASSCVVLRLFCICYVLASLRLCPLLLCSCFYFVIPSLHPCVRGHACACLFGVLRTCMYMDKHKQRKVQTTRASVKNCKKGKE